MRYREHLFRNTVQLTAAIGILFLFSELHAQTQGGGNYSFDFNSLSPSPISVSPTGEVMWSFSDSNGIPVMSAYATQVPYCYHFSPDSPGSFHYIAPVPLGCMEDALIAKGAIQLSVSFSGGAMYTNAQLGLQYTIDNDPFTNEPFPLHDALVTIIAVPGGTSPATCTSNVGPFGGLGIGFSQTFSVSQLPGKIYSVHCEPGAMTFNASIAPPLGHQGVTSPVIIRTAEFSNVQYKIIKIVDGKENSDEIKQMDPAVKPCGKLGIYEPFKLIRLKCVESGSMRPCPFEVKANLTLKQVGANGGHDHPENRPFGKLNATEITSASTQPVPITIPANSGETTITYHSPAVAGDVELAVAFASPSNLNVNPTTLHVKAKDADTFQVLNVPGLSISVASHPEGVYVSSSTNKALEKLVNLFKTYSVPLANIPNLRSEAASLPLGGVFDFTYNWTNPHCGHRDGRTIDISKSNLPDQFEEPLYWAADKAGFTIVLEGTGGGSTGPHFHLHR